MLSHPPRVQNYGSFFSICRDKKQHIFDGRLRRVPASLRVEKDRKAAWKKLQGGLFGCSGARARFC
jgi:hypothetical protein